MIREKRGRVCRADYVRQKRRRVWVETSERERDGREGGNKNGDKESTQRGGEKGKLREQTHTRPMEGDGRRGGRTKHVYRVSKMFAKGTVEFFGFFCKLGMQTGWRKRENNGVEVVKLREKSSLDVDLWKIGEFSIRLFRMGGCGFSPQFVFKKMKF